MNSGSHDQNTLEISISWQAGRIHQGAGAFSVESLSGAQLQQQNWGLAIGYVAVLNNQRNNAVTVGASSGVFQQGTNSVAIGLYSGYNLQG